RAPEAPKLKTASLPVLSLKALPISFAASVKFAATATFTSSAEACAEMSVVAAKAAAAKFSTRLMGIPLVQACNKTEANSLYCGVYSAGLEDRKAANDPRKYTPRRRAPWDAALPGIDLYREIE